MSNAPEAVNSIKNKARRRNKWINKERLKKAGTKSFTCPTNPVSSFLLWNCVNNWLNASVGTEQWVFLVVPSWFRELGVQPIREQSLVGRHTSFQQITSSGSVSHALLLIFDDFILDNVSAHPTSQKHIFSLTVQRVCFICPGSVSEISYLK